MEEEQIMACLLSEIKAEIGNKQVKTDATLRELKAS
jgi:hypothetical protein